MLTYNYERGPLLKPITAPLCIHPGYGKAASLFRPPQPVRLARACPFVIPLHVYHDKPDRHSLFALEQVITKVDDVPYGSPFGSWLERLTPTLIPLSSTLVTPWLHSVIDSRPVYFDSMKLWISDWWVRGEVIG